MTRILQTSLGGNAKTLTICTVSPCSITETESTIKVRILILIICSIDYFQFACRAKRVQNKPIKNVVVGDTEICRYLREIDQLKIELEQCVCILLFSTFKNYLFKSKLNIKPEEVEALQSRNDELFMQVRSLTKYILRSTKDELDQLKQQPVRFIIRVTVHFLDEIV